MTKNGNTLFNGCLTATDKLNRAVVLKKYREQLDALYASPSALKDDVEANVVDSEEVQKLKALVARVLPAGNDDISLHNDSPLVASGLDSISALKLVSTIKQTLNVDLPVASLYQPGMTVQHLAQAVSAQQRTASLAQRAGSAAGQNFDPEYDVSPYFWFPELMPSYDQVTQQLIDYTLTPDELIGLLTPPIARTTENSHIKTYKSPGKTSGYALFERLPHKDILLTGATGFLGLYLVKDFLDGFPEANVHCIVRGRSDEEAYARLVKEIEFAHLAELDPELVPGTAKFARIKVIAGDLALERFGMSQERWDGLCDTIDTIVHNGVWVNLLFPYEVLRSANVVSTAQLLKMALTGKNNRKAFHYVSTESALKAGSSTTDAATPLFGFTGYPLTKLVCEVLLNRVEDRIPDLPIVIHRAGSIFAHPKTGHLNIIAFIHKLICSWVQAGFFPEKANMDMGIDWTPVDYYSKVITHLVRTGGVLHAHRQYNISSPHGDDALYTSALGAAIRSFGYPLQSRPPRQWRLDLLKLFDDRPGENILEPFRNFIADGSHFYDGPGFDLSPMISSLKPYTYDEATHTTLVDERAAPVVECPHITEDHIHAVLRFCIEKGYIKPPNTGTA